jgi:hypothetical protein
MPDAGFLIFTAVVIGLAAISYFAPRRRRRKPDDLMALNEALHRCGTLLRSYMPNHIWHDCDRPKGHDVAVHHCPCGTTWANSLDTDEEIADLNEIYAAPTYEREETS